MLQTVKDYICSLPDISFSEYFLDFIMSTQDDNLRREFNHIRFQREYSLKNMGNIVNQFTKEILNYDPIIDITKCVQ